MDHDTEHFEAFEIFEDAQGWCEFDGDVQLVRVRCVGLCPRTWWHDVVYVGVDNVPDGVHGLDKQMARIDGGGIVGDRLGIKEEAQGAGNGPPSVWASGFGV